MENPEKESRTAPLTYEVIVRREAQTEIQEAFDYYEDKNEGLGFDFIRSLDASLQSVKRNPFSYQTIYKRSRRALLRKFPYALFYVVEQNRIIVIACFNQRRRPIEWHRRS
jgi:plasmid stabilization system protein ParE